MVRSDLVNGDGKVRCIDCWFWFVFAVLVVFGIFVWEYWCCGEVWFGFMGCMSIIVLCGVVVFSPAVCNVPMFC